MKKLFFLLIGVAIGYGAYKYFFAGDDGGGFTGEKPKMMTISKNSEAFNQSFGNLLTAYYGLSNAFVNYDTADITKQALLLKTAADSVRMKELKADSNLVLLAMSNAETLSANVKGLLGETVLEEKKRSYQTISAAMVDLIRIVKYDKEKIYIKRCPMAFNETEAAEWLGNDTLIVNPYLGKMHAKYKGTMLNCGEVIDTLNYTVADTTKR
jgi:hypothetical protein